MNSNLTLLDIFIIVVIAWAPDLWVLHIKPNLAQRIDRAQFALACDDEANDYHNLKPSFLFRVKKVIYAFVMNK